MTSRLRPRAARLAFLVPFRALVAALAGWLASGAVAQESAAPRPNVIYILADDLGWADVGYHGSEILTPNLDRLAAEGARLDQFYVYPTCSPTRVALVSGRYPSRYGVYAPLGSTTKMLGEHAHLPLGLRAAGYTTHISGKWHIGETPEHRPLLYGFDTSYGYLRGQIDPYTHRYKFGDHVTWHRNDEFFDESGHVTDLITDEAIRIVRESGDEPFFIYLAHHTPHYPLNEPPKWIALYDEIIEDIWRRHYAGAVTHMDDEIGRLLDALDEAGKAEDTLVIFTSDNGGQERWMAPEREYNGRYAPHTTLGNNEPLRGWKGDLYEGGIRVPAVARWPAAIQPGTVVESPTHICDWAPTLIGLAGGVVDPEWELEGRDIMPLLAGGDGADPRTLYWRTPSRLAVREGDWKLIRPLRDGPAPELFHLAEDPNEERDRASEEPERLAAMLELIEGFLEGDQ
jgi:arylsulfatase A-like enzyme